MRGVQQDLRQISARRRARCCPVVRDAADGVHQFAPSRLCSEKLLLAFGCKRIELDSLVRLGTPDSELMGEALSAGYGEPVSTSSTADGRARIARPTVSAQRSPLERSKDQHVEGAVQECGPRVSS